MVTAMDRPPIELDPLLAPLAASATAWCGFDAAWYRLAYGAELAGVPDAALAAHYAAEGRRVGHAPNMYVDEAWYRAANPDVAAAVAAGEFGSGYEHYCAVGYLTRSPHWLYDEDIYALYSPDLTDQVLVAAGCANRYDHYLKAGARENRIAHLLFQPAIYRDAAGSALEGARNPFEHYLRALWSGAAEGTTSPYFDPAWYRSHCAAARDAIGAGRARNGLHHFLAAPDACDPLAAFSAAHYGAAHPEAAAAVAAGAFASLYDHFLKRGVFALAAPAPGIDLAAYLAATPEARGTMQEGRMRDVFVHYLAHNRPLEPAPEPAPPARAEAPAHAAAAGDLHLEVDATILCPPDGMVLIGWMLAPPGLLAGLRLVCGDTSLPLDPGRFVPSARPDVLARHAGLGFEDPMCGFLAFVPVAPPPGERMFIEAALVDGSVAMRNLPAPALHGMPAIRAILDRFDLRYGALAAAMADTVAPAVERLGAALAALPLPRETIRFGAAPVAPALSLVIPLHGRVDFLEVQLALFSRSREARDHDIIYVLDDPPRRREVELLAASAFARFGIPFRLVLLGRNAGYAAANNAGIALARGRIVGLVNSDVFPTAPDDFDRLAARLDADPGLGAVGPLLLFEDGSVQHQGMAFRALPEFAGWHFPLHSRKGLLPPADDGLHPAHAITAACMLLPRAALEALEGLDERFLVGDFEDADLCLRLAAAGRRIAVDHGVRMHHLERQSQAGSEQRWRMNLTLYNAWTHEQRWGETLAAGTAR